MAQAGVDSKYPTIHIHDILPQNQIDCSKGGSKASSVLPENANSHAWSSVAHTFDAAKPLIGSVHSNAIHSMTEHLHPIHEVLHGH